MQDLLIDKMVDLRLRVDTIEKDMMQCIQLMTDDEVTEYYRRLAIRRGLVTIGKKDS